MRLGHILPALGCGAFAIGCGLAEVFRSPEIGDVVLTYTGPDVMRVGDRIPVSVSVTVDSVPLPNPRVLVVSLDTARIVLSANGDTLIARAQSQGNPVTLTITFVASIFTDSFPAIEQSVRVNP